MSVLSGEAGDGQEQVTALADSPERDEKVLELREAGRTYAGIARELGIERTLDANAAFNRALRRRPSEEKEGLRNHEMARLDALAERVRRRSDLDEAEVSRRIRSLDRLKKTLLSA